jgi:hypothetical protein
MAAMERTVSGRVTGKMPAPLNGHKRKPQGRHGICEHAGLHSYGALVPKPVAVKIDGVNRGDV